MASLATQQIAVKLYGDSHLCENHFFPAEFEPQLYASGRFLKPDYFARGGATIGPNVLVALRRELREAKPTIHIIAIGGNNLRRGMRAGRIEEARQTIRDTVEQCVQAIEEANQRFGTQYHHALVCSIIPSPEHTPEEKQVFMASNQELLALTRSHESTTTYVNFDRFLRLRNKAPNMDYFSRDQIHLNQQGAKKVVELLMGVLTSVRRNQVGLPPRR